MKRIIILLSFYIYSTNANDLTIIGYIQPADGIGSIPIRIINCLNDNLKINWINTRDHIKPNLNNLPEYIKKVINNTGSKFANISMFTDLLWYDNIAWYMEIICLK